MTQRKAGKLRLSFGLRREGWGGEGGSIYTSRVEVTLSCVPLSNLMMIDTTDEQVGNHLTMNHWSLYLPSSAALDHSKQPIQSLFVYVSRPHSPQLIIFLIACGGLEFAQLQLESC